MEQHKCTFVIVGKLKQGKYELLQEYNQRRESNCLVELSNQVSLLRMQKRHFPGTYTAGQQERAKEPVPEGSRDSWVQTGPLTHKEKRHFPAKSHAIFG
ncbi:spermatogenesis-associated protein 45 [Sorex fumeus]|uniref:spermatogenesis-associated protein 45 n=1 Tax=Sorex fumeus TaxID=62283 RepID=UPI0024AD7230|nr:spermatogenesis-associated protein 45 [Sorex fumeus]